MPDPFKIFIAYSRKDQQYLEELRTHFKPLELSNKVMIWYDGLIEPGSHWETSIKTNLNNADIILLLVSSDSIASEYFYGNEVKTALERHKQGKARVMPLIVRPCAWQATPLGALQALPKDGKAISGWADKDSAYTNIVENISVLVKDLESQEKAQLEQEIQQAKAAEKKKLEQQAEEARQKAILAEQARLTELELQSKEADAQLAALNVKTDDKLQTATPADRQKVVSTDKDRKKKDFTRRLFAKIAIGASIIALAAFFMIKFLLPESWPTGNLVTQHTSKDVINIGVTNHAGLGFAGGQYFNEGFQAGKASRFYKDYGFEVNFKVFEYYDASHQAFKNGDIDLLWAAADMLPIRINDLSKYQPQVLFQTSWSRGVHTLVSRRGIQDISDLKGKKIAISPSTSTDFLLHLFLQANNMTGKDALLIGATPPSMTVEEFKKNQVDAAVVCSPDGEIALKAVPGAQILGSTQSASHAIADILIAKKEWINQNQSKLTQLYEGWMKGSAEINATDNSKRKAAGILAAHLGINENSVYENLGKVRLTTHGDNVNFMGLNSSYKGMSGELLYNYISQIYKDESIVNLGSIPWSSLANTTVIRSANLTEPGHSAEKPASFPALPDSENLEAFATNKISVNFRSGTSTLDDNGKYIIDITFANIARAFTNTRIRIEGNTDNTGNLQGNIKLSKKRAEAIKDYLVSTYDIPAGRITTIGNGPNKPLAPNETAEGRARNRRTDFMLLKEQ